MVADEKQSSLQLDVFELRAEVFQLAVRSWDALDVAGHVTADVARRDDLIALLERATEALHDALETFKGPPPRA